MKKTTPLLLVLLVFITCFLSCTKAKDTLDAFDSVGCINTLSRLSNNEDDLSCSELSAELNKLERDCSQFLNDESRANIQAIKALCQDN